MKIVLIISDISRSGGTERATTNVANMLEEQGHDIIILSISTKKGEKSFYEINAPVNVLHLSCKQLPSGLFSKFGWFFDTIKRLKTAILNITPDLIIGQGHNVNSMLPFLSKSSYGSIIGCEHIVFDTIPKSSRMLMSLMYQYLDGVVVLSEQAKEKVKTLNKNIFVIPNALPFLTEETSPLSSNKLMMVGRLSLEKGYDRLVVIANRLKDRFPDWHIDIFGEGPMKNQLLDLYTIENLNTYITIHEPVKNIKQEYLNRSVFIMTSYTEAMPMVILEAKSCGLPIVAYNCEGTSELILNNEDGFLIDNNDDSDFVEKVSVLIKDKILRSALGNRARANALFFSKENVYKKWKQVIEG
ncbi:glycosyltransferase family 4 protein [Pedobacter cryoconitis]|uniref:Glycosyltransferase involved in cell wall biosynthesis n=1 Tax=Pedobacter cryoconitis TaxID=188932 RepID=A0A7X0J797_9SPHI|nr:glycosyltransferase family 4 protein [Pedobacter cryoconitis]MBB6502409.1 glycosyltransferase involved in cell wall biosynthesis [Pedobacter cryoconitis]